MNLKDRVFECLEQNDLSGLVICLDEGYDVNEERLNSPRAAVKKYGVPEFYETLPSRAFRRAIQKDTWDILAYLIDRYGFEHLKMADHLAPDPQKTLRNSFINSHDAKWEKMEEKNFESSLMYFCFWHMTNPKAKGHVLHKEDHSMIPTEESPWYMERIETLRSFHKNCVILEERNRLSGHLSKTKDDKETSKKFSAL